jgi:RNA polymerase sigma factor (sigma-70 family)
MRVAMIGGHSFIKNSQSGHHGVSFSGSVSVWIEGVKAGCESAATHLWTRYRHRVVGVAQRKLTGELRSVADEEDVAVIAFQSFLRRCRDGSYPDLQDRDDLWRLLMTITVHKASNQVRDQNCQKRGLTPTESGSSLQRFGNWEDLASCEASPELIATVADSLNHLLSNFSDGELRQIVLYKLEGYSNAEVAEKIGRSLPTIERRLRLVREKWLNEMRQ